MIPICLHDGTRFSSVEHLDEHREMGHEILWFEEEYDEYINQI